MTTILNFQDLQELIPQLAEKLVGAQLQDVYAWDKGIVLGHYKTDLMYLVLDFSKARPFFYWFENNCPVRKIVKSKPLALFLNSNAANKRVVSIELMSELGRAFKIIWGTDEKVCELEVHLIPHQVNAIARTKEKKISWEIVRDLKKQKDNVFSQDLGALQIADLLELKDHFSKPIVASQKQSSAEDLEKTLAKKQRAIVQIENDLPKYDVELWQKKGDAMKSGSRDFIDAKKSLAWNINEAFSTAQKMKIKRAGALARIEKLKNEIANPASGPKAKVAETHAEKIMARSLTLTSGKIAYAGKKASENLKLLREASPWDVWIHLKDYPSSHIIVRTLRNQEIGPKDLQEVGEWALQFLPEKRKMVSGQKIIFTYTECRFVRPIKGDRLGRVTVDQSKEFSLRLP